jgi:hypothetical protein
VTDDTARSGEFVWHDLMTLDPAKGKEFYTQLIGYGTKEMESPGGSITILSVGESDIADVVPLDEGRGIPSHWMCYVSVPNADEAGRLAEELGGAVVVPPFDTPYGRIVVLRDPAGAHIQAIAMPGSGTPERSWPPRQGEFAWYELMAPDPDAVTPFYEKVFGWKRGAGQDMGEMGTYWMFMRGETAAAGLMKLPPQVPVANWLPYMAVDDVDAATSRAVELGATVMAGVQNVPGTGKFSILTDPTGAAIALFTAEPM